MYAVPIATVVVAIIAGTFALLQKWVEKRYNRAKDAVEKNSAEVEDMTKVVEGFKQLNEGYRTTIKEKDDYIKELLKELAEGFVKDKQKEDRIKELEAKVSQLEGKN